MIRYFAYVKAGIDLKEVDVEVEGEFVRVILPKAKIVETLIDEKSISVYDETFTPFNPTKVGDYKNVMVKEKQKLRKKALAEGILTESSEQAHKFVATMLQKLGYENIQIQESVGKTIPNKILER